MIPGTLLDILPVHQREVNFRRPLQLDTFHGISQRLLACCCAWIQWMSFFWEKNLRTLKGCQLLVKLLAFSQEAWKKDALFAQMQVPLAQPQRDNAAGGWNCPVCNNYNYAIRTTKRDWFQTWLGWRVPPRATFSPGLPVLPHVHGRNQKFQSFFLVFFRSFFWIFWWLFPWS